MILFGSGTFYSLVPLPSLRLYKRIRSFPFFAPPEGACRILLSIFIVTIPSTSIILHYFASHATPTSLFQLLFTSNSYVALHFIPTTSRRSSRQLNNALSFHYWSPVLNTFKLLGHHNNPEEIPPCSIRIIFARRNFSD